MAKKKAAAHGGGHGWFVTFADLMGLLVAFFVMLVAFSNQDQKKLQIVAGSMREAFGTQTAIRYAGIVEVDGLPTRPRLKNADKIKPEDASSTPSPDEKSRNSNFGARIANDGAFALASASLRQAMQEMPEIAELSKQVMIEESKQGLNIELVDQNGSSMFPEGSKEPYERTRRLVQRLSATLQDDAVPGFDLRPHRGEQAARQAGLRSMGAVRRPRQLDPQDSRGGGRADRELLHGGRAGRHPAVVPGRSLRRGQPPRHDHPDARGAAASGRPQALNSLSYFPRNDWPWSLLFSAGGCIKPAPDVAMQPKPAFPIHD